jgi:hypothetical protein
VSGLRIVHDLFPDAPRDVSLSRQVECVGREIRLRERTYPRWVAAGRMSQARADDELAAMRAVLDTLSRLAV